MRGNARNMRWSIPPRVKTSECNSNCKEERKNKTYQTKTEKEEEKRKKKSEPFGSGKERKISGWHWPKILSLMTWHWADETDTCKSDAMWSLNCPNKHKNTALLFLSFSLSFFFHSSVSSLLLSWLFVGWEGFAPKF